jgi:hypothetical protein
MTPRSTGFPSTVTSPLTVAGAGPQPIIVVEATIAKPNINASRWRMKPLP